MEEGKYWWIWDGIGPIADTCKPVHENSTSNSVEVPAAHYNGARGVLLQNKRNVTNLSRRATVLGKRK